MKLAKVLLWLNGLAFIATGVYGFAARSTFAEFVGYRLTNPASESEFLANYGGLYLFYGFYLVISAVRPRMTTAAITVLLFTSFGLMCGRLAGFMIAEHVDSNQFVFAIWEGVSGVLCILVLFYFQSKKTIRR